MAAWGGIDVLVNNAGINQILPIALLEEADWDAVMDVNVKGAYLFSRAVLRHDDPRARRAHPQHRLVRLRARRSRRRSHYAAAKSALRGLTEALAREVGRYDIKVNLLAPGLLDVGLGSCCRSTASPSTSASARSAGSAPPTRSPRWRCSWSRTTTRS